jgi:transcriptional regulator with XRE-family HTH domain
MWSEGQTMKTMAELIDDLFRSHRKPNGREYSHVVCLALEGAIEPSHLGKLRNGTIKNPKRDTLLALCRFFKTPPAYFFPELQFIDNGHDRHQEHDDLIGATVRLMELPPEGKQKLEEFLRTLQRKG